MSFVSTDDADIISCNRKIKTAFHIDPNEINGLYMHFAMRNVSCRQKKYCLFETLLWQQCSSVYQNQQINMTNGSRAFAGKCVGSIKCVQDHTKTADDYLLRENSLQMH